MLFHWESSQRPLFIRTVWVGGHRHAILTEDDPAASVVPPSPLPPRAMPAPSPPSPPQPDSLRLSPSSHPLYLSPPLKPRQPRSSQHLFHMDNTHTHSHKASDILVERNPLSERVLQWLDLAGRNNTQEKAEESRLCASRRSVPEVRSTNYFTDIVKDFPAKLQKTKTAKSCRHKKYSGTDGNEEHFVDFFNDHRSLASSCIQNYAKASYRNEKIVVDSHAGRIVLPSNIIRFEDSNVESKKCTSAALGRKIKSKGRKDNVSVAPPASSDVESSDGESDLDAAPQHRRRASLQTEPFERDYIDMIRRRIVETSFNMKAARRQLHIFIPSLPKKSPGDSKASSVLTCKDGGEGGDNM